MKVFAHRGASGDYPENTLLALEQAILARCDGIELDVQYHPSGELILSHDSYILDAHQQAKKIQNIPIDELLTLPAGHGEFITTLPQALVLIDDQCELNIEIKSAYLEQQDLHVVVREIVNTLKNAVIRTNLRYENIIISSFNHYIIQEIKHRLPEIRIAALLASCPIGFAKFSEELNLWGINLALDCVNKSFIEDAHKRGLNVGVYTVNTIEDIDQCLLWNVDSIFSDFPKKTKTYINKTKK